MFMCVLLLQGVATEEAALQLDADLAAHRAQLAAMEVGEGAC